MLPKEVVERSIWLSNISSKSTEDSLTIHFQKRKFGGGDIDEVKLFGDGTGFITLESKAVAESVLKHDHIVDGVKVNVRPYSPPENPVKINEVFHEVTGRIPKKTFESNRDVTSLLQMVQTEAGVTCEEGRDAYFLKGSFEQVMTSQKLIQEELFGQGQAGRGSSSAEGGRSKQPRPNEMMGHALSQETARHTSDREEHKRYSSKDGETGTSERSQTSGKHRPLDGNGNKSGNQTTKKPHLEPQVPSETSKSHNSNAVSTNPKGRRRAGKVHSVQVIRLDVEVKVMNFLFHMYRESVQKLENDFKVKVVWEEGKTRVQIEPENDCSQENIGQANTIFRKLYSEIYQTIIDADLSSNFKDLDSEYVKSVIQHVLQCCKVYIQQDYPRGKFIVYGKDKDVVQAQEVIKSCIGKTERKTEEKKDLSKSGVRLAHMDKELGTIDPSKAIPRDHKAPSVSKAEIGQALNSTPTEDLRGVEHTQHDSQMGQETKTSAKPLFDNDRTRSGSNENPETSKTVRDVDQTQRDSQMGRETKTSATPRFDNDRNRSGSNEKPETSKTLRGVDQTQRDSQMGQDTKTSAKPLFDIDQKSSETKPEVLETSNSKNMSKTEVVEFIGKRKVTVSAYSADITEEEVGAIVCPVNEYLRCIGEASELVVKKSGTFVKEQLSEKLKASSDGKIQVAEVIYIPNNDRKLSCGGFIFVVCARLGEGTVLKASERIIFKSCQNSLNLASGMRLASISIPSLSDSEVSVSSTAKFAKIMINAAEEFRGGFSPSNTSGIKYIKFVNHNRDVNECFQKELLERYGEKCKRKTIMMKQVCLEEAESLEEKTDIVKQDEEYSQKTKNSVSEDGNTSEEPKKVTESQSHLPVASTALEDAANVSTINNTIHDREESSAPKATASETNDDIDKWLVKPQKTSAPEAVDEQSATHSKERQLKTESSELMTNASSSEDKSESTKKWLLQSQKNSATDTAETPGDHSALQRNKDDERSGANADPSKAKKDVEGKWNLKSQQQIVISDPKRSEDLMLVERDDRSLPGFEGFKTIVICYHCADGIQKGHHPNPGQPYEGIEVEAYLPDTSDGRRVLALLRKAFDAKRTFRVVTSNSRGMQDQLMWNVMHKTTVYGGPHGYGYPDPSYLLQVTQQLASLGITE